MIGATPPSVCRRSEAANELCHRICQPRRRVREARRQARGLGRRPGASRSAVIAAFFSAFFGARVTDPDYEHERDLYRAEAKDDAKKIRQAVEWLKVPLDRKDKEYRYATYRASW